MRRGLFVKVLEIACLIIKRFSTGETEKKQGERSDMLLSPWCLFGCFARTQGIVPCVHTDFKTRIASFSNGRLASKQKPSIAIGIEAEISNAFIIP